MPRRFLNALIVTSTLMAVCGCSMGPQLGEVSGRVTMNGEAVPFAYVVFQPIDPPGAYGSAYASESGEYALQYSKSRAGAPVGKHSVTIRTASKDEIQVEDKTTGKMVTPPLPKSYRPRLEAKFEREVVPGRNEMDFDLTSTSGSTSK
jgi:hypothetical protein